MNAFKRFFDSESPSNTTEVVEPKIKENEWVSKERIQGKISKLSDEGWGFISSRELKFTRIFFHWTSLKQDTLNFLELKKGMECEFTPVEIEGKGHRAIQITILGYPKKS